MCQRYLQFHDISTGWRTHQSCPYILGLFVQGTNISWILIVIHHLCVKTVIFLLFF